MVFECLVGLEDMPTFTEARAAKQNEQFTPTPFTQTPFGASQHASTTNCFADTIKLATDATTYHAVTMRSLASALKLAHSAIADDRAAHMPHVATVAHGAPPTPNKNTHALYNLL